MKFVCDLLFVCLVFAGLGVYWFGCCDGDSFVFSFVVLIIASDYLLCVISLDFVVF